jgi:hypothetical protein
MVMGCSLGVGGTKTGERGRERRGRERRGRREGREEREGGRFPRCAKAAGCPAAFGVRIPRWWLGAYR